MAKIPEREMNRLTAAGLFLSEPRSETHVLPGVVLVGKPKAVPGNSIPGYESQYGLEADVTVDAPFVQLYSDADAWYVVAVDFTPGPGPGDFTSKWPTVAETVDDILEFYFGDQKRMNEKTLARGYRNRLHT